MDNTQDQQLNTRKKTYSSIHHTLDVDIAVELKSVELALLVHHFQFWIRYNKALGKNKIEGKTWTYQTIRQINAYFPYWSEKQIQRMIPKLIEHGILIKANHNKSPYDRTAWYAFKDEERFGINHVETLPNSDEETENDKNGTCMSRNREMENSKSGNEKPEIGKSYNVIDTKTDAKENNTPPTLKGDSASAECVRDFPKKIISHGKHIKLTETDYANLVSAFGKKETDQLIEEMNDYCSASKPGGYKDWAAAIRQWMRKRKVNVKGVNHKVSIEVMESRKAEMLEYRKTRWLKIKNKEIYFEIKTDHLRINNDKIYFEDVNFYDNLAHYLLKVGLE